VKINSNLSKVRKTLGNYARTASAFRGYITGHKQESVSQRIFNKNIFSYEAIGRKSVLPVLLVVAV